MRLFYFILFFTSYLIISINGLKVLSILPFGSKSHWVVGHEIMKSLVEAGHDATALTTYPSKTPIKNYEEIDISGVLTVFEQDENMDPFLIGKLPKIATLPFLYFVGNRLVNELMKNENYQKFMTRKEKFDVCFLEVFHAESLTGVFDHFDCIYIAYTTSTLTEWADFLTSNVSPTSYVANPILPYAGKLDFSQRFWNTLYTHIENFLYYTIQKPNQRRLYKKYFPNAKKSMDEIINSPAVLFHSSHVSVTGGRPYLPNMIEIGGIHVPKSKPLPKDIQEFLDSATEGAVLFSMGSIIKAEKFPVHMREAFVGAFGKIKQKVLWKYENETLPNKSDNVMISKWLPQRDALAHPNIKLFISHGGYLGTTEATSEGVPILGMPLFGDQGRNIADVASQERGLLLSLSDITEENVLKALVEILNNPKYKQNAETVAKRFNDRVMTPQQEIVYWTEYAARHKGATFLKAAGSDLNYIEFNLIDVYLLMFAIFLLISYIKYKALKFIFGKLLKKFSGKQKTN